MAYQSDWQRQRLQQEVDTGRVKRTANVDAFLKGKPMPGNKPLPDVFGQLTRDLAKLDKQINRNIHASEANNKKGPSLSAVKKAAKEGKTLYAAQPSNCFIEVSFTGDADGNGVCSMTFAHKTEGTWDVEMTLDEFLDFAKADSLGGYFNQFLYGA